MRIDKFLKVSRIIKRRTVANEACDASRITVNGRPVKASYDVKVGQRELTVRVTNVLEHALKADASCMYEVVEQNSHHD